MKATFAYVMVAALFGLSQASVTPLNNIIRHEYNLNARAGVHGNLAAIARRDEAAAHTPDYHMGASATPGNGPLGPPSLLHTKRSTARSMALQATFNLRFLHALDMPPRVHEREFTGELGI
ncbi:hypothetical protein GCG54_00005470 [Colletotrichum gloeosporioides]|uniref:Uncharacterized protein n=1 Tax=Colletotrichum gloeosporioides TaxID=474922 RepID=A0A8H4CCG6_COLGL|nr:uncharacterized protein GCG54_00005470 [Colletotrichum gloeosporioides]KAF3801314.1 hypothetical protein GCG54_00005470 [Colletotrichum gloeosporioides]